MQEIVQAQTAEIQRLKSELGTLQATVDRTNAVIGSHVAKLPISPELVPDLHGLKPVDALDLITKRGGGYQPLGEAEKVRRSISVRNY